MERRLEDLQPAAAREGRIAESVDAPAPMLQHASASLSRAVLQRKIASRLQLRRQGGAEQTPEQVHQAAEQGLAGSAQSLPHLEQIQRSFGGHDVSGVQAFVGGAAAEAGDSIGASAYALGNSVAFQSSPDLHTAAHEAAHVVQQRAGVQLRGGVGEAGDAYEQHADAVADLVVSGRPAEGLLSQMAGGGHEGVQRKETAEPAQDGEFGGVSRAVAVDKTWLVSAPGRYRDTLIDKLAKDEVVQLTDLGAGEKFNQVSDPKYKWWKVKVTRGAHAGKEGWVMATLLGTMYKVNDAGTSTSDKVGKGEVTVSTGQAIDFDGAAFGDNMFSLKYQGKDADKMRWLQFIWREVVGTDDKGKASPVTGSITTSGGTYQLTEGGTKDAFGTPKKENYNTDTASSSDPFYEAGFAGDRTADSGTMIDQPGAATGKVTEAFNGGAKSVVSRAHFTTFLVKDEKAVQYRTHIDVNWSFAKPEDTATPPKGAHTVSGGGATDSLPATIAERFHEQFPAYKEIK